MTSLYFCLYTLKQNAAMKSFKRHGKDISAVFKGSLFVRCYCLTILYWHEHIQSAASFSSLESNSAYLEIAIPSLIRLLSPAHTRAICLRQSSFVQLTLRKNLPCARNFGKVLCTNEQNLSKFARTRDLRKVSCTNELCRKQIALVCAGL